MGKAALKAIAAIGSGGLTTAALWILTQLHVSLTTGFGAGIVALVTSAATWLAAKAVAAQGPPAPSAP